MTESFIQVTTTIDSEGGARQMARLIVERRLGACVQVFGPITSVYWWQERIEEATEWACLIKAPAANYDAIEQLIRSSHSYTVPEILATPIVQGSSEYLDWLGQNAAPAGP